MATAKKTTSKVLTILLVEDEPVLANLYGFVLKQLKQAKVLTAGEELEALGMISKFRPGLVVLDLMIPTTAKQTTSDFHEPVGFEILRRVKTNPKTKSTTVVILSNLDADEHRKRAEQLGAADYIVKAMVQPKELAARIGALVKS